MGKMVVCQCQGGPKAVFVILFSKNQLLHTIRFSALYRTVYFKRPIFNGQKNITLELCLSGVLIYEFWSIEFDIYR